MVIAVAAVALCTVIVYPLKQIAPVVSLSVVYLPAVLVVSLTWGAWMGVCTALLSAVAFNFFHLPPVGQLSIRDSSNWVALVTFVVVAVLASSVAEITRARGNDAQERRREADLAAEMARLLLRGDDLSQALPTAAARLAQTLGLSSAAIEMEAVAGDDRTIAFPLREGTQRLGTLLVGADTPEVSLRRLQERVVPALEGLLSAALEREALLGGVVETVALRRADTVKTALLRAVSHDLRSPLTAIATAGEALSSPALSDAERLEMAAVIQEETRRLARLVDNLLDLSRLQAGAAEPRRDLTSVDDLIRAALQELAAGKEEFSLSIDRDLPLVEVDPVQMERALVNVLENARRHSGGHPVSVRARAVRSLAGARRPGASEGRATEGRIRETLPNGHRPAGDRVIVRVVDRGPGIPRRSSSVSSSRSTVRAHLRAGTAARAWVWRSRAALRRPTGARFMSSRCRDRERRSCSSFRSRTRARRPRTPRSPRRPPRPVDTCRPRELAGAGYSRQGAARARRRRRVADPARAESVAPRGRL